MMSKGKYINYTKEEVEGAVSANPIYFDRPCHKAKGAYITSEQTEIKEAYESIDIEVFVMGGADYSKPMLEYISNLDDDMAILFQDRMQEVKLELKQDGSFTAKTIKKLDALVEKIGDE